MALIGKLIWYVEISSTKDVFHGLWIHKPNDIATICPSKIHGCELISCQRGVVGSIVCWDYTHEGKNKFCKQVIEAVDDINQTIAFNCIGGELVDEIYKSIIITCHVEPKGGKQLAIWTFEFERPNTSVPYPTSLMDYLCGIFVDMDVRLNAK